MKMLAFEPSDLRPVIDMAARGGLYTWLYWLAVIGSNLVAYLAAGWAFSVVFSLVSLLVLGDSYVDANRERVVEKWWSRMDRNVVEVNIK